MFKHSVINGFATPLPQKINQSHLFSGMNGLRVCDWKEGRGWGAGDGRQTLLFLGATLGPCAILGRVIPFSAEKKRVPDSSHKT